MISFEQFDTANQAILTGQIVRARVEGVKAWRRVIGLRAERAAMQDRPGTLYELPPVSYWARLPGESNWRWIHELQVDTAAPANPIGTGKPKGRK